MKNPYEQIHDKIYKLIPNLDSIEPGEGVKLKSQGYMDLCVDVLWRDKEQTTISFAHYYKQNGDLVPDPDMEIKLHHDMKAAEALSCQDSFGYRQVYPKEGFVNPSAKKDLNSFLNKWLNNLKVQGHKLDGQEPDSTLISR